MRYGGKQKYIKSGEELRTLFVSYCEWVETHPILKEDYVGKDANRVQRELQRPLSWVGFESWLFQEGVISDLNDYENNTNDSYKDYQPIIRAIKQFIETNQFEGATVGIFNQNIIARKLGLIDKTEQTQTVIRVVKPKKE
jgi:hypothetical protein